MTREIAQAVAKTVAYRNCNKPAEAERWFRTLAKLLGFEHLLKTN